MELRIKNKKRTLIINKNEKLKCSNRGCEQKNIDVWYYCEITGKLLCQYCALNKKSPCCNVNWHYDIKIDEIVEEQK